MSAVNIKNATTAYNKVTSSASAVTLVEEHGSRVGLMIYNASTAVLYVRIDGTATTTDYSFKLVADAFYEMPYEYFTDKVTGIWASANGFAAVTEIRNK